MDQGWTEALALDLQGFADLATVREACQSYVEQVEDATADGYWPDDETLPLFGSQWHQAIHGVVLSAQAQWCIASWQAVQEQVVAFLRRWPRQAPFLS